MNVIAVLSLLVAMSTALPQYGHGGAYPPNAYYQGQNGAFGWPPGFYGGVGYPPFHHNVANVHRGASSPGGFITNAINNARMNATGVQSSWSYFPGVNGQSNDLSIKPTIAVTNDNTNPSSSINSEQQSQLIISEGALNGPSSPAAPAKLNPNEIKEARESILAYREKAAILLRQADQIEQILLQQQ